LIFHLTAGSVNQQPILIAFGRIKPEVFWLQIVTFAVVVQSDDDRSAVAGRIPTVLIQQSTRQRRVRPIGKNSLRAKHASWHRR
jgi:hypothetical protein